MECNNIYYHQKYVKKRIGKLKREQYGPAMCLVKTSSNFTREELNKAINNKFRMQVDINDVNCNFIKDKRIEECPCFNMVPNEVLDNPVLIKAREKINSAV